MWSKGVKNTPARRTPGCATCPSTTPTRTGSGWRSARSPWTCWPGALASHCPERGDLRAETAAAANPGRRRAHRPVRATPRPAHRPRLAPGRGHHHRPRPALHPSRPLKPDPQPPQTRTRSAGRMHGRGPLPPGPESRQRITIRPLRKIEANKPWWPFERP
jgi:hypothetical protein